MTPDALLPSPAAAAHRRAEALFAARRIAEAAAAYDAALALGMEHAAIAEQRWMCAMLLGDFERAWRVSDAVLRAHAGRRCDHLPYHLRWVWDGTPLAGRRVLLRCYHGLGDTLQFIRYVPLLRRIARRVVVAAQPALLPLVATMPGIDALRPLDAPTRDCDVEIESMELPHAFRTTLATLPCAVPYLSVPEARIAAARRLVAGHEGTLKVGLAWAAGDWDTRRSLPVELLASLNALPHVALFNLQRGPALDRLAAAAIAPRFAHREGESPEVLDTAALLVHLDLVVTVDTMLAHLAGALGRPVWTLLHFAADWRWLTDRADSPWYPTMRLLRQPAPGRWEPAVERVATDLARMRRPRIDAAGPAVSSVWPAPTDTAPVPRDRRRNDATRRKRDDAAP